MVRKNSSLSVSTKEYFIDNSDLLACTVCTSGKNGHEKVQRFLVTDQLQLILVEPDNKRMGWAIVRFVGLLQVSETRIEPVILETVP